MTLTKADLIDSIHEVVELPRHRCAQLVESIMDIIKEKLESGEDVLISGFGKFCVKEKKERRGRNPATGEDLMLGSRRVVLFRSSGSLRKKVNGSD